MKLENVTKKYGEKTVLDGLDIAFEAGKICAVLGESGAGKTTLLNVIAGNLPFEGKVEGVGRVSYLFQDPVLLPNLSVEGNLKLVLEKEAWGKIPEMLTRVGLSGRGKDFPKHLSGGERQRVAIARAFLCPHDTLLMDEPFSSLDLKVKKSLLDLLCSLWEERGETVVFVTHDVKEAVLLSHRAIVLGSGKIVCDVPVAGQPVRDFFSSFPEEALLVRALCG